MATIIKTRNLVKMILVLAMFLVLLSPSRPALAIQSPVEITVDTTTDSNATAFRACTAAANDCSLRGAISKANNTPANRYTIHVPAGVYTLALTGAQEDQNATGDLDILTGLNLSGVGAGNTIIQAGGTITNSVDRVFHVRNTDPAAGDVSISALTIRHGRPAQSDSYGGGGICFDGWPNTLLIENVIVEANSITATGPGGGIALSSGNLAIESSILRNNYTAREGGGLWTSAVSAATITDSAIVNNQAYEYGGGIQVNSVMTVTNTTISGNYAVTGSGGGISEWNNAKLWLFNVTIASNWTNGPSTWAMYNPRATYAVNTIIASAPGKAACSHGVYQDTNNLGADNTCGISTQAPNLRLGALADWGGDTYTHILLPGSPAIDGGDNASCPAVDQRGVPRPYDGNYDGVAVCDIGALEWAAKSIYLPMVRR